MPRNKTSTTSPSQPNEEGAVHVHSQQSTPRKPQHPQKHTHQQQQKNVSALTQQLEQVSFNQQQQKHSTSPSRPRSSKRTSKPDLATQQAVHATNNHPSPQQNTLSKPKRSPKNNKVNSVKHLSTPSKPTSIPSQQNSFPPSNGLPADLAAHYAGPTFHHSPAPSSLPVPSFFASKANNTKTGLHNGCDSNSPPNQGTPIKLRQLADGRDQDDSPLAPFFKADREEKARLRSKYTAENGITGSPTRPASAGGITERSHLRSESPLMWQETPRNGSVNGRFSFHNHSTSELPFQMDDLGGGVHTPRNHLVQRFRATTEPPSDYRPPPPTRTMSHTRNSQSSLRRQSQSAADLENDTIALKNLLSIKTPTHSMSPVPSFPNGDLPPSPSPFHHSRTRSMAQPPMRRSPPSDSQALTRRVVSTSGTPTFPPTPSHLPHPQSATPSADHEDQTIKAETALRKVLNLA